MQLTVVSDELLALDYKVLAAMTDGSTVELSVPWGLPKDDELRRWRWKTRQELVDLAQNHNSFRRHESNHNLHLDKCRRLGWDYAKRGY